MATFSDDFNRADSTSLGANWTEWANDTAISSNRLINNDTNKAGHTMAATGFTPADADYQVQCVVNVKNVGGNLTKGGPFGRGSDNTHMYHARAGEDDLFQLYKFDTTATLLGQTTETINKGTDYTVKLTMQGTTIKAYLDGTEKISVTDSTFSSAGSAGMRIFPDNTGTLNVGDAILDDFSVNDDLGSSPSLSVSLSPSRSPSLSPSVSPSLSPSPSVSPSSSVSLSLSVSTSLSLSLSPSASVSPSSSISLSPSSSVSASVSPSSSISLSPSLSSSLSPSASASPSASVSLSPSLSPSTTPSASASPSSSVSPSPAPADPYSVYVDKFNRSDNTNINTDAPMRGSYTEVTSDFQIVSQKLKAVGLNSHLATLDSLTFSSADYTVQSIIYTDPSYASGIGLVFRYVDTDNYYYALINTVAQKLLLYKRVAGTAIKLDEYAGGYTGGSSYTLKVVVNGPSIQVFVDGTRRILTADSTFTSAGKVGFWTDYGNSTFDNFVVMGYFTKPAISSFTPSYTQPSLPGCPAGGGWPFNSIDFQVVTKSDNWNQDQTKRLNEYQEALDKGANTAAIGVPYDNLVKYTNYVTDARTKGLRVFHRSHWDSWEGDNSIPSGVSRQHYLEDTYDFIVNHSSLFAAGDIFVVCVEPNNANDHSNYTFRTPETSAGSFTISKFNDFIKDQVTYANAAFTAIGLGGQVYTFAISPSLSLVDLAGQTLDGGDGGNSSGIDDSFVTTYLGGILSIDHYLSDAYRDDDNYGIKYSSDLDKLHTAFPNCQIFIGEWGYHTTVAVGDTEQDTVFNDVITNGMQPKDYILGVNFWVHMGSNTASLWSDTSGTIDTGGRPATDRIEAAFTGFNGYCSSSPSLSLSLSPSLSPSLSISLSPSASASPSSSISLSPSLSISLSPSLSSSLSVSLSPSVSESRSPSTSFEPQTLSIDLYKVMFITSYNDKYSRKNNSYVPKYL